MRAKLPALSSQPCSAISGGNERSPQVSAASVRSASSMRTSSARAIAQALVSAARCGALRGGASAVPGGIEFRPTLAVAQDEFGERGDVVFRRVERRNVFEALAARGEETIAIGQRNFLERFQTVDCETRTQHLHMTDALP